MTMTLNCIQVVYNLIIQRFFCIPGPKTKNFERFYLSFNKQYLNRTFYISVIFHKFSNIYIEDIKLIFKHYFTSKGIYNKNNY